MFEDVYHWLCLERRLVAAAKPQNREPDREIRELSPHDDSEEADAT